MPVCHDRKLAFCHIPRTGGVSISNALKLKVKDKHFPASWYRKTYPDYTLFATLRPYEDRVHSAYGWNEDRAAAALRHGTENVGLMTKPNEYFLDCEVDFLLRFGHLQDDLNAMLTKLGHKTVILTPCNSFKK